MRTLFPVTTLIADGILYDDGPEVGEPPKNVVLVLAREDEDSADERIMAPGALYWREPPLSIKERHDDDSEVVGRMDRIDRTDSVDGLSPASYEQMVTGTGPYVVAYCTFDLDCKAGFKVARQVAERFLKGCSVELGRQEVEYECTSMDEDGICSSERMVVLSAEIGTVAMTPFPALPSSQALTDADSEPEAIPMMIASAPQVPPDEWFDDPGLTEPTGLTVTDDGQVYGHAAYWNVCHLGLRPCRYAPRTQTGYERFKRGTRTTTAGTRQVGLLTDGIGHLNDLHASGSDAIAHYDNTNAIFATVNVGEDEHGIWVAGALFSDLTPTRIARIRASSRLSGDWRPVEGLIEPELYALLAVNGPGFDKPHTRSLVAGGQLLAMIDAPSPGRCGCGDCNESEPPMPESTLTVDLSGADGYAAGFVAGVQSATPAALDAVTDLAEMPGMPGGDEPMPEAPSEEPERDRIDAVDERVGLVEERLDRLEAAIKAAGIDEAAAVALAASIGQPEIPRRTMLARLRTPR